MYLHASLMRHKERQHYLIVRNGILRLQARARGVASRMQFMQELCSTHRSFRIKNGQYELPSSTQIDLKSNFSCIVCIVSNENNDLDDAEQQMYRFETQRS